uniref:EGF-like domain-containing protein n=1 Tax=Glossina pallidipes TaxID=7398 RepID=A0A1A9ZCK6_GLOPL
MQMAKDFKLFLLLIAANVNHINNQWPIIVPQCPPGYELRMNLCHYVEAQPNRCQQGYFSPCTANGKLANTHLSNSTFANSNDKGITTTSVRQQKRCPHDSVFIDEKCRKIICTMGEYYQGQCLHPACPPGLVWRGKRCQKPGYLETIIEIDNVLINKIRDKPYTVIENSTSHVTHHNDSSKITPITTTTTTTTTNASPRRTPSTVKPTSPRTPRITTKRPVSTATTTKPNGSTSTPPLECCVVVTPRICKLYGKKWVCFNRRSRTCAARICTASIVYLKAPEIRYRHPLLIMPPNPNLTTCQENSCDKFSTNNDTIDCSGCSHSNFEKCSSYCYRYMCPAGSCAFIDLEAYCNYYPGKFGCLEEDGCIWNWC